jgi:hypothetical protein
LFDVVRVFDAVVNNLADLDAGFGYHTRPYVPLGYDDETRDRTIR